MKILLLRGLNTYGDDNMRLGWFNFGDWYTPMETALKRKGFTVHSIRNMGFESFESQATRAENAILQFDPDSKERNLILLGHSTGGLIARILAHQPQLTHRIHSIISLATPHKGTPAAQNALDWVDSGNARIKVFKIANYDLKQRKDVLKQYSKDFMEQFNQTYTDLYGINYQHVLFTSEPDGLSVPLYLLKKYKPGLLSSSDGLIPAESQIYGDEIGRFSLDHFGSFGYFLQASKKRRNAGLREFQRLIDRLTTHLQKSM